MSSKAKIAAAVEKVVDAQDRVEYLQKEMDIIYETRNRERNALIALLKDRKITQGLVKLNGDIYNIALKEDGVEVTKVDVIE